VSASEINEITNGPLEFSSDSTLNSIQLSKAKSDTNLFIKLKYKTNSMVKCHVESTCSCAKIIDSVFHENEAEITINYVGTISDGVQNFSILISDENKTKQIEQKILVFIGGARCMLGRNEFTITELSRVAGTLVPLRLFQTDDEKDPVVNIKGFDKSLQIKSLSSNTGLSWYNVRLVIKEPELGIYWINVTHGDSVYKLPIIIKS
jgi:hypothetical protein